MKVYDLGELPGQYSMLIFHALARMNEEALVIVSPQDPLVSIGYFQDLSGVDQEYCRENGISMMRRELGGGTTFLDRNQIFYQVILKKDNPLLPGSIDELYQDFSKPAIETYRKLGIETRFKPINDIITAQGKKIAGEGGGDIGDCIVFVGGVLLDFDFDTMTRVLRVPDEKFRDKMYKTMQENMSTVKLELGYKPDRQQVVKYLIDSFAEVLGPLERAELSAPVLELAEELGEKFSSTEFLNKRSPRQEQVRIGAGVSIQYGSYKATGGLIQTTTTVRDRIIEDLDIGGDFSFYPREKLPVLSNSAVGLPFEWDTVRATLEKEYELHQLEMPGVDVNDICRAIFQGQAI